MRKAQTALSGALQYEFQKDLDLFKHFLLLLSNSGPIRNVELMWNEALDPTKQRFKNRVGTGDVLVQLQPETCGSANRNSPSTLFCDLVHGQGAHEEGTCSRSDVPAQQRCRATGCAQVYACHVGLTDIAVPIIYDGQYLGTLFSGQVLTQPPTKEGFKVVRQSLAGQSHIDFDCLEGAYYQVPVVEPAKVAEMVRVLELFARYLANSWKRLQITAEFQRNHDRELILDRKELAATLLSGELGDREELKALARRSGLQRLPDRVLILQIKHPGMGFDSQLPVADQLTLNRLSHIVEDLCQSWQNTLAIVVRPGEICIFTSQEGRSTSHQRITLQELADAILEAVQSHSGVTARIGVSAVHVQPVELVHAYQEACSALSSGAGRVSFFSGSAQNHVDGPMGTLSRLAKAIQNGAGAPAVVQEFLAQTISVDHSPSALQQSRAVLTWAVEHLALQVISLGADASSVRTAKERAIDGILNTPSRFTVSESFRHYVDVLAQQVASTFSQREQKIVLAVSRLVEERGAAAVSIQNLANALHLSSGHLSRVFRRTTCMTLETFLIRQRVELAKRNLLDPRLNVAEVAERCGFCNPAYFSSVFKKYMHCTPREFASQPHRWEPLSSSPLLPVDRVISSGDAGDGLSTTHL